MTRSSVGTNMIKTKLNTDKEGFLRELSDWSIDFADELAASEEIELTPEHWEIINLVRDFYIEYAISPSMRVLVKLVKQKIGNDKGRSIHILLLFPDHPLRSISKIAGLPKPTNCD
jgi:tRNA 2-thiouridine synthesizing protein E